MIASAVFERARLFFFSKFNVAMESVMGDLVDFSLTSQTLGEKRVDKNRKLQ